MTTRRAFLKTSVGGVAVVGAGRLFAQGGRESTAGLGFAELPDGAVASGALEALSGKVPLIKRTYRPPNYETPVEYFNEPFTPNNAFFVRYHISNIPEVSAASWRLRVGGDSVQTPLELSLNDLKMYETVELTAVCLCSGNRRGLFEPHVPGVEWGPGAMGNARWKGVRLRDVLGRAGLKKEAVEIVFNGADSAPIEKTPDFVKSIPVWKAMDPDTLIAFEMNGEPLPHWNGFPARIVVPGWTGTYWMKHVIEINANSKPFDGFWMKTAYRIPKGKFALVDRFLSQEADANTPITEMVVNSLITTVTAGQQIKAARPVQIAGIAWDGGAGIHGVEVSVDGGETWRRAELGPDLGRYSFRQWSLRFTPVQKGRAIVMARAANRVGSSQTFDLIHNPAGYHHNVVQRIPIQIV